MYYRCPNCKQKYKYAVDLISYFGDDFGRCPFCKNKGTYEKDGARTLDDSDYMEVE